MHYTELRVWQQAIDLCEQAYRISEKFPERENFGLTAQLRRSAVSIASNIAEGEGRLTKGEKRQFLSQARGSLFELETQLMIANRMGYLADTGIINRVTEARRTLNGYIAYVKKT